MASPSNGLAPLLNKVEVGEILGASPRTIERWVANREISFIRVGSKTMFKPEHITEWITTREVRAS
jgi:excisionase family DNA binding protein